MAETKAQQNTATKKPQTWEGVVVSDKMRDTVVVRVDRYVKHPKYHKFMRLSTRIKAADRGNAKKVGDKAVIQACRPVSKSKAFKVIK